jgi:Na+-driven multidrug efflux pump
MRGVAAALPDVASVGIAALLTTAAVLLIGEPDPGAALAFLSGGSNGLATVSDAAAFSGVLCWMLVAVLLGATVVQAVREHAGRTARMQPVARSLILALIAAALLVTAVLRHSASDTLCCAGQASQFQQVLRLAG